MHIKLNFAIRRFIDHDLAARDEPSSSVDLRLFFAETRLAAGFLLRCISASLLTFE